MNRLLKDREKFTLSGAVSGIPFVPKTEQQHKEQIFGKMDPEKIIDAYEEQLGIRSPAADLPRTRIKSIMLSPGNDDDDNELFEKLNNDFELYQILEKSPNWTQRGEYKCFVIYRENLDVKEARAKLQAQQGEE